MQDSDIPLGFGQQEYFNETTLHPLALIWVAILGCVLLVADKRRAILGLVVAACTIPPAQRIVIAGLDFDVLRIMVMFGVLRVMFRGEYRRLRLNATDYWVVAWCVIAAVAHCLRLGTVGALINKLGSLYDVIGMYLVLRILIRDLNDISSITRYLCGIAPIIALAFFWEYNTGRNPFAALGGVPEITAVREGRLRCQGPFPHPILAGCFWASLVPLLIGHVRYREKGRLLGVVGIMSALLIVYLSSSSTPALGVIGGLGAWALFSIRTAVPLIRWSTFFLLLVLHVVMTKPVWHLLARASIVGGSTGWHRYALIDRTINYFSEWWLMGTSSTAHWGHMMYDLANQYVREGVKGGILALMLFVGLLLSAFKCVGVFQRRSGVSRSNLAISWGVGSSLFAISAMFLAISISHSQQNLLVFFLILTMCAVQRDLLRPVTLHRGGQGQTRIPDWHVGDRVLLPSR